MIQVHTRPVMIVLSFCAVLFASPAGGRAATGHDRMECWDIFEVTLAGPSSGNPFVDVRLKARFSQGGRAFTPEG